ncbi:WAT1-related protein At1g43650-like [Punica granatum]|uniref:WAT1-related protein n=1 Tax=Punica granatum TaxID=22663 RepID=A0A218X3Y2_PUNGR|nr:WAT1-related protein At1g43650-like [Punica granatum]XP_031395132.1 WAT1-related protein At1g43650-like [Punica granatum]OWM79697.1 hypothetical protein CDL15_Pgr023109 [Punica granatum]
MGSVKKCFESSKALVGMLMVQAFATGLQLLTRVILNNGTFIFALMTYRHVVAAICVAPFAFIFERGKNEKLSFKIWVWLFFNALAGITAAMSLYYYGLRDTTATYAVNFLNLIPIITFIFAIIARVEALRLHTWAGRVKIIGAVLCVAGALSTSLYKGKSFYIFHHDIKHSEALVKNVKHNWMRGTLMLTGSCFCYSTWYMLQVKMNKIFPLKYWTTMLTCIIASVQSMLIGLCLDRSSAAWKLGFNLPLLTIVYSGALATAATFCLISWAIAKRGPTYPSMFNPLTLIFVAVLEALILGEAIRLGMVLGTILIITGLYSYLWGKRKESKAVPRQAHLATVDVEAAEIESVGASSTAVIVPSSSPARDHDQTGVEITPTKKDDVQ